MREKDKTTILKIATGPIETEVKCPYCEESTIMTYDDFTSEYGEEQYEWGYVWCSECGKEIKIEDTEWD